ncbi:hypothetical protein C8R43DRAFT_960307 [Mycena crocata]|nr:hypothetical protein C8R43DRAFT_960307 [Mycena crocata]
MSADNGSAAALALNPRPHTAVHDCKNCGANLLELAQSLNGNIITNWARWFQKCPKCEWFFWHNFPTDIQAIPEDVQMRFAIKTSSKETGTPLLCPEDNCFTASKQRRRANRECCRVPPRCSVCCKGLGGCRTQGHRVTTRDMPLSQVQSGSRSAATVTSSSTSGPTLGTTTASTSVLSSQEPSSATRSFARPLSENYARGYLSRHRHVLDANARLETTVKLKEFSDNSVYVVLWAKAEQPELPKKDARVAIATARNARILLRSIDVSDEGCLGMDEEISRLLVERLLALSGSDSPLSSRHSSSEPSQQSIVTSGSDEDIPGAAKRRIAPLRFPLTNASDMISGLSSVRSLRTQTSQAALEDVFQKAFPKCAFKSQTVYKHLKIYDDALKLDIIKTATGKWSDVVKIVEEERKKPIVIDISDDDKELEYNILTMKKEVYSYASEGRLQSGSLSRTDPILEMDVLVANDYEQGHKMNVHMGNYSTSNEDFIPVALKRLNISTNITPYGSREMAIWAEGARLAECHFQYLLFQDRAATFNVDLAGVDILPTFLFSGKKTFIAQPWEFGVHFSLNDLEKQHCVQTTFGYKIYDSRTHMVDCDASPSGREALDCDGSDGINEFVVSHICGPVCKALGLF